MLINLKIIRLGGGIEVLTGDKTLYISQNGEDKRGNGSEEQPIKTFGFALDCLHHYINPGFKVVITFLTDYQDPDDSNWSVYYAASTSYSPLVINNPLKKNVTLGSLWFQSGHTQISDINIKTRTNTVAICAQNNAEVSLYGTININMIEPTSSNALWAQRSGVIYLNNALVINITNSTEISMNEVARAELGGIISRIAISRRQPTQINFSGLADKFIFATQSGSILLANYIEGHWTNHNNQGKRFEVHGGSLIDTNGKGSEWFPGPEDGVIQEGGLYI